MAQTIIAAPIGVGLKPFPVKWRLREVVDDAGLAVFDSTPQTPQSAGALFDGWSIRERFLSITQVADLAQFLSRTGRFSIFPDSFSGLTEWQEVFRRLMATRPAQWPKLKNSDSVSSHKLTAALKETAPRLQFRWKEGSAALVLYAGFTLRAIVATIQIDHLSGAQFRFCQRADCGQVYRVTSGHRRIYCSHECGHLVSIRRGRAAKQTAKTQTA